MDGDLAGSWANCVVCNMDVLCDGWNFSVGMYLALATGHGNVHEAAGVQDTLVGATLGVLLLLLGLNLYSKFQLG